VTLSRIETTEGLKHTYKLVDYFSINLEALYA